MGAGGLQAQLIILSYSHGAVGGNGVHSSQGIRELLSASPEPSDFQSATSFLAFYTFCCFTLVRTFLPFPLAVKPFQAVLLWEYFWCPSRLTHGECRGKGSVEELWEEEEEWVWAKLYDKELI